jgi:hypothetical protein
MANNKIKSDAFQFMIDNRKVIINEIRANSSIPIAWDLLSDKIPELKKIAKFNTFKGYVRALNVIDEIMDKKNEIFTEKKNLEVGLGIVRQDKKRVETELGRVRQNHETTLKQLSKIKAEKEKLENELNLVRQEIPNQRNGPKTAPKHVNGWGVQLKGNYYRLFKKINGKVKWIHVGRSWNLDLAEKKIRTFMG